AALSPAWTNPPGKAHPGGGYFRRTRTIPPSGISVMTSTVARGPRGGGLTVRPESRSRSSSEDPVDRVEDALLHRRLRCSQGFPLLGPEDALFLENLAPDRDRRLGVRNRPDDDTQGVAWALGVEDEVLVCHVARLGQDHAGHLVRLVDVPPETAEDGLGH